MSQFAKTYQEDLIHTTKRRLVQEIVESGPSQYDGQDWSDHWRDYAIRLSALPNFDKKISPKARKWLIVCQTYRQTGEYLPIEGPLPHPYQKQAQL